LTTVIHSSNQKYEIIVILSIIISISLFTRLNYLPLEIPFKTDAITYFSFAFEVSKNQQFPEGILKTNDGWPLFLSPLFSLIGHYDMMTLINAQRITSIIISSITVIPIYFLCKKIVSSRYALVGAGLFGLNHKLMENSILGLTESLSILLITLMLLFSFSKTPKFYTLSFVFLSLASIVRYESLLFLIPLSIIFFLKFHNNKKSYLKFSLFILIFILILSPIAALRLESNGMDGLTSHAFGGISNPAKYASVSINNADESNFEKNNFIQNAVVNTLKFLGLVSIPLFIFFLIPGIYNFIKTRNQNIIYLLIFSAIMILPAMYAYGREIQDTRFLLVLFPIFCCISVYGLDLTKKLEKFRYTVLILFIIIGISILFFDYDQPNHIYNNEIYLVSQNLIKTADGVNDYPGNSYIKIATLEKYWPNSLPLNDDKKISFFINKIPSKNYSTLEEYILDSKDSGLSHIVLMEKNRSAFLNELFFNYEKYPYLEKTFDSKNLNFENHILILKINYSDFERTQI
tara:strand:+ start:3744 stop:5297 length:1554 start_codon:yes stop_codon:yes gene_type:complete